MQLRRFKKKKNYSYRLELSTREIFRFRIYMPVLKVKLRRRYKSDYNINLYRSFSRSRYIHQLRYTYENERKKKRKTEWRRSVTFAITRAREQLQSLSKNVKFIFSIRGNWKKLGKRRKKKTDLREREREREGKRYTYKESDPIRSATVYTTPFPYGSRFFLPKFKLWNIKNIDACWRSDNRFLFSIEGIDNNCIYQKFRHTLIFYNDVRYTIRTVCSDYAGN